MFPIRGASNVSTSPDIKAGSEFRNQHPAMKWRYQSLDGCHLCLWTGDTFNLLLFSPLMQLCGCESHKSRIWGQLAGCAFSTQGHHKDNCSKEAWRASLRVYVWGYSGASAQSSPSFSSISSSFIIQPCSPHSHMLHPLLYSITPAYSSFPALVGYCASFSPAPPWASFVCRLPECYVASGLSWACDHLKILGFSLHWWLWSLLPDFWQYHWHLPGIRAA